MNQKDIASLINGTALVVVAWILKSIIDLYLDGKRRELEVRKLDHQVEMDCETLLDRAKINEAKALENRDHWRTAYWELFEKQKAATSTMIGSPAEVEQQVHALEVYKKTAQEDPSDYPAPPAVLAVPTMTAPPKRIETEKGKTFNDYDITL